MTRVVAVEWDGREVRMVVGAVSGNSVALEHVLSQSIPDDDLSDSIDSAKLTAMIRTLASKAGLNGGEILVAVGRSRVELRNLQLPKADMNELPDMVRFTALRQFANIGDTWPIDFVPLPMLKNISETSAAGDVTEMQEVIAMTINPATISQIRKACTDAGFMVTQIGLRPVASGTLAAAVTNSPIGYDSTVLLIDILADEADMVVLEYGHVSFMRTVRLPMSEDGTRGPLPLGEIRRTLIAAVNARPGLTIERIVLWSDPVAAEATLQAWQPNLDVPIQAINPLSLIELKKSVESVQDTGRFAPLVGLLLQRRLSNKGTVANTFVDFLNPRKKIEKKKPIRQYLLAAAAAVLLIGGGFWWYRSTHQKLDTQIAELNAKLKEMESTLKQAQKNSGDWKKMERFLAGDIQWLDELSYLSKHALKPEEMVVKDTQITVNQISNLGEIKTLVAITDQKLQPKVEEQLRDRKHKIGMKGVKQTQEPNTAYSWTFDPLITVEPVEVIDPTTLPPPKKSSVSDADSTSKEEAPRT